MALSSPAVLDFELKWRFGARSAILVFETAKRFVSEITLVAGRERTNAKDLLSLMELGPVRPKLPDGSYNFGPDAGTRFQLMVEGPDADAAYAAMADLFTCGERVVQCRNSDCISSAILIEVGPRHIMYSCSKVHLWTVDRETGFPLPPDVPPPGIRSSRGPDI